jgi:inner membrane protein
LASIGHIAMGMVAARALQREPRYTWRLVASMVAWSALSMLPDADVIGFRFGVKYADVWGHRGATHSFAFALASAFILSMLGLLLRRAAHWPDAARTFAIAALVLASHPVLDTLTDGGLGCALWWPFDTERYFAPWNPIPVAPIGRRFFSNAGLSVALTELLLFTPAFLYAVWPRAKSAAG